MNKKNTKKYNKRLMANKMCFDPIDYVISYQYIPTQDVNNKKIKTYTMVENDNNPKPGKLLLRKNQLLHFICTDEKGYIVQEVDILITDRNKIKIRNENGKVVERIIELFFKILNLKFISPVREEDTYGDLDEQEQY